MTPLGQPAADQAANEYEDTKRRVIRGEAPVQEAQEFVAFLECAIPAPRGAGGRPIDGERLWAAAAVLGEHYGTGVAERTEDTTRRMFEAAGFVVPEKWPDRDGEAAPVRRHREPLELRWGTITHGRHCTCTGCAIQDWGQPGLADCVQHGPSCPAVYAPLGAAGEPLPREEI